MTFRRVSYGRSIVCGDVVRHIDHRRLDRTGGVVVKTEERNRGVSILVKWSFAETFWYPEACLEHDL